MKRTLIMLLLAFLLSSPFAQRASSQPEKSVDQQKTSAPPEQAAKSKFLFFQLLAPESIKEPLNVEFLIRVDNILYLVEKFIVSPEDARLSPAIEILATEPARLKSLYKLARTGGHQVSVTVTVNDEVVRSFSFSQLRKYNRELKNSPGFRPLAFHSKLIVLRPLQVREAGQLSAASDCEMGCYDQYASCAEATCGDAAVKCEDCYPQLNACLAQCPPPPPTDHCPSTTCSSVNELIGATWYGWQCLTNIFQQNRMHDHYLLHYKVTTTCQTVDSCAGTQSTSTSYSYFDWWCDYDTGISCEYAYGWASNCY